MAQCTHEIDRNLLVIYAQGSRDHLMQGHTGAAFENTVNKHGLWEKGLLVMSSG
jgi:hypothetical protein